MVAATMVYRPITEGLTYKGVPVSAIRAAAARKLDEQAMRALKFTNYYDGDYPLKHLDGPSRDIFLRLLKESFSNWSELVVNAVAERLQVVGFRFGGQETDDTAWQIWQANQLDADSEMGQTDSLVCGSTFASVTPNDDNPTGVDIYLEHPSQTTVLYEPGHRRKRRAAYKRYCADGVDLEVLSLPDATLTWIGDAGGQAMPAEVSENVTGIVPVVEITPAPRTIGWPRSELESVVPIQNRINTTIYNRLVASDFGAFRQITATGIKLQRDPSGAYKPPFNVGADRLLVSENKDAAFSVIPESNLRGYLDAVEADVQHLAAITQTPPHYLLGKMINIPGSGMKMAETGLVAKIKRRSQHLGEGWEETMRIALGFVGDPRAVDISAETIWADFESRSEGETVDALIKMKTLGVPNEVLWQRWGATPSEIERWQELNAANPEAAPGGNANPVLISTNPL
jgi:hypothetical protein